MYIVHTVRPEREDLWTPFTNKELAEQHVEGNNGLEDVTATLYQITPNDFADPHYYGDFFLMEVEE